MSTQRLPAVEPFDAIVVGSGATGGVAAMELTAAGLKVLVLEAGPQLSPRRAWGTPVGNLGKQLWRRWFTRTQAVQERHGGYWETNPDLYANDTEHPYRTPADQPYRWIHARQVGGRSMTWGGVLLRFSDYEFKAASRDGAGVDWPLCSADLSPWYGRLERFFGAFGSLEGLAQLPDGEYVRAQPLSPGEEIFKQRIEAQFGRRVIVSRGIPARRAPEADGSFSKLSSPGTTLAAARATGRLTLQADAIASRLLFEADGRCAGVEYFDRRTRSWDLARGRLVFLCAGTVDSLRILLHSQSRHHPHGVGASSGMLGRGLMDHIVSNLHFTMPEVRDVDGFELRGSDALLVPRWQNLEGEHADHLRGYGVWGGIQRLRFPRGLRKTGSVAIGFLAAMGETLCHPDNQLRLDDELVDAWGLPAPHFSCRWRENDQRLGQQMRADAVEMIAAAGGVLTSLGELVRTPTIGRFFAGVEAEWSLTTPGLFVHEVGGARMGDDPRSSVVNSHCQVWDAPNVFVTDGACWPSSGWANPTLTQMAITARACAHAVGELRRRNLT